MLGVTHECLCPMLHHPVFLSGEPGTAGRLSGLEFFFGLARETYDVSFLKAVLKVITGHKTFLPILQVVMIDLTFRSKASTITQAIRGLDTWTPCSRCPLTGSLRVAL